MVSKGAVAGRVPVLGEDDGGVVAGEAVGQRDDFVAVRDGQGAAGEEIGLEVDEQEGGLGHGLHPGRGTAPWWHELEKWA
jgi:hypothetical protein